MKLIYLIARRSRGAIVWALAGGVISGVCTSGLLATINSALNGSHELSRLIPSFVLLAVAAPLARIVSEFLLVNLGQTALADLRMEISSLILKQPLRRLEELGSHRLLAILLEDIPTITGLVSVVPLLCVNSAALIACLAYMSWLSPPLFGLMCVFMVLGVSSYLLPLNRAVKSFSQARDEQDNLQKNFNAMISGTKELKLNHERQAAFLDNLLTRNVARIRQQNISGLRIYTLASSWGQLLAFVVIGLLIFLGSNTDHSARALTGFALCLLYLVGPLQMIMNSTPLIGRARVAVRKVERLNLELVQTTEENRAPEISEPKLEWGRLDLIDVGYIYSGESSEFELGPISLSISPGEIVFLTGGNGSGKTTLAKLLCGLYSPSYGEIRLQGVPITEQTLTPYRQFYSAVFSDFYLFEELLGFDSVEVDGRATDYLRRFGLSDKVRIENGRFSTINLSQGQRKRLALLIAYLEDRPVYLLDEWAADQDPSFKQVFYHELLPDLKQRGKPIILVSHDERFYHIGDRIITMESGRVISDTRVNSVTKVYTQLG